jgi:membrane-associated phospholipid phosphatase
VLLYPALTLFTIVVTGNHFWFDGIGGLIALALGFLLGNAAHKVNQRRLDAQFEEARSHHPSQSATN